MKFYERQGGGGENYTVVIGHWSENNILLKLVYGRRSPLIGK